jgi:hypothetical protein
MDDVQLVMLLYSLFLAKDFFSYVAFVCSVFLYNDNTETRARVGRIKYYLAGRDGLKVRGTSIKQRR